MSYAHTINASGSDCPGDSSSTKLAEAPEAKMVGLINQQEDEGGHA